VILTNDTAVERARLARSYRYGLRDRLQHLVYRYSAAFGASVEGARAAKAAGRLIACGCRRIGAGGVGVHVGGPGGAGFSNVQTCGSTWACPVCGAKVRQERAREVDLAVLAAAGKRDVGPVGARRRLNLGGGLLTLTVAHDQGDELASVFGLVSGCWRSVRQSAAGRRWWARWGVVATIRSLEVTYGEGGWHPHLHVVLFFTAALSHEARADCEDEILTMWKAQVQRRVKTDGTLWRLPNHHGARLDLLRTPADWREAGRYCVEVSDEHGKSRALGLEVARHDLKVGRRGKAGRAPSLTPFELAEAACDGDVKAANLWAEYVCATKGRQAITFSAGLRAMFEVGPAKTDEEVAAAAVEGTLLVTLTAREWALLWRSPGARAGVLDAAEHYGSDGVRSFVAEVQLWRASLPDAGLGLLRAADAAEEPR
jgi:hypothetical protein